MTSQYENGFGSTKRAASQARLAGWAELYDGGDVTELSSCKDLTPSSGSVHILKNNLAFIGSSARFIITFTFRK